MAKSTRTKNNLITISKYGMSILAAIALCLTILFGSFFATVYDRGFYANEYEKQSTYDRLAVSSENSAEVVHGKLFAENVTANLLDFLKGKEELKYFSAEEQSHMRDVGRIFHAMSIAYYASLVVFVICVIGLYAVCRRNLFDAMRRVASVVVYGSCTVLCIFIALLFGTLFSFDALFSSMHLVLFPQGNFTFDSTSLLITLFPQQFFIDAALRIFLYACIQSLLLLALGWLIHKHATLHEAIHDDDKKR